MKKSVCPDILRRLLSLALGCILLSGAANAQVMKYVKSFSNPSPLGGDVYIRAAVYDAVGNMYVAGSFGGVADVDPGPAVVNLISRGGSDILLEKFDAAGNLLWAKNMGGSTDDVPFSMTRDAAGNIYLAGTISGTSNLAPGSGAANFTSAGSVDAFIAKYDADGNYIWARAFGNTDYDYALAPVLDNSGNIYLGGKFTGSVDFNRGGGAALTLVSAGTYDMFISKYNGADGSLIFAKRMGGTGSDEVSAMTIDASGNIYTAGSFNNTVDFDPGAGTANLTATSSSYEGYFAKYDANGNYLFAKPLAGSSVEMASGIALDAANNIYITGNFYGTADFDPGAGTANLVANGTSSSDIFLAKYTSAGVYVWAKAMSGNGSDFGNTVCIDASNNVYVTGGFSTTVDFDPGAGTANLISAGLLDAFIAKYNSSGVYIWAKAIGGVNNDNGIRSILDASGNIVTTGYFTGTADLDPGAGVLSVTVDAATANGFISKLASNGTHISAGQFGGYSKTMMSETGKVVAIDGNGNSFVGGTFQGSVDFDPSAGTAILTSAGNNDVSIAKYDATGNYLWAKSFGGTNQEAITAIAADASGNIYINGHFQGTVDFDPGAGVANLTSAGMNDIFVVKLDASGNYVWAKSVGGTGQEVSYSMALDASGNCYLTGNYSNSADFDPGAGAVYFTSLGSYDVFVLKLTAAGNYAWAKSYGGTNGDNVSAIHVNAAGSIFLTGHYFNAADFDPGAGVVNMTPVGGYDAYILKLDAAGNYTWAKSLGGAAHEYAYSIGTDADGNIYIGGQYNGVTDFDPGAGVVPSTSVATDLYIVKLDAAGNYVWSRSIGGAANETCAAMSVDPSGNCYIVGSFSGVTDFDAGTGIAAFTSIATDGFLVKYNGEGDYEYARVISGPSADNAAGVACDGAGNVLITGSFNGTADFDPANSSAASLVTSFNSTDMYFARYENMSTLPVKLEAFGAAVINNGTQVQVNWTVSQQVNNAYFEIERSRDGVRFEAIGRVTGCLSCPNRQQYNWIDNNPYTGRSYYRLKQVDIDNAFMRSGLAAVTIGAQMNTSLALQPNITTGAFNVVIKHTGSTTRATVQVLNVSGGLVKEKTIELTTGTNRLNYDLGGQASGSYYIRVVLADGTKLPSAPLLKQ